MVNRTSRSPSRVFSSTFLRLLMSAATFRKTLNKSVILFQFISALSTVFHVISMGSVDQVTDSVAGGPAFSPQVLIENEDGEIQEFEILASKDKHGALRKAVPTLPVALAVCCLVLNMVPGLGTMVSGFAVLCGYPTEHSSKGAGVFYNLLVALLQLILAPIIVGWIWSIQRGIILVQESMNQKIEQRERRMSQDVTA
nr:protein stum homolog [Penaeus vannamei]